MKWNVLFYTCFFATIVACLPLHAHAAKPYRCSGKVQYRPCSKSVTPKNTTSSSIPPTATTSVAVPGGNVSSLSRKNASLIRLNKPMVQPLPGPHYVEVITQQLNKVSTRDGLWFGRIEGNGEVHLTLNIFVDGNLKSSRYMGRVVLKNKATPFAFKSTLPKEKDWTWKVTATAG